MSDGVSLVVEGITDAVVLKRLFAEAGLTTGPQYIMNGKTGLDARLAAFNNAARFSRWLVLRDLDHDAPCAPKLIRTLLPSPAPQMRLHVAVRAVESWLLADREAMAHCLGVPVARVAGDPDALDDPKDHLLALARRSRRKSIREALLPAEGTSARFGPGYVTSLIDFTNLHWRPHAAEARSPSLARLLRFLRRMATGGTVRC